MKQFQDRLGLLLLIAWLGGLYLLFYLATIDVAGETITSIILLALAFVIWLRDRLRHR